MRRAVWRIGSPLNKIYSSLSFVQNLTSAISLPSPSFLPYHFFCGSLPTSATRFGEITLLWQVLKVFGHFQGYLIQHWAKFRAYFGNFLCHLANFHCCQWPTIEHIIEPSGHTVPHKFYGLGSNNFTALTVLLLRFIFCQQHIKEFKNYKMWHPRPFLFVFSSF